MIYQFKWSELIEPKLTEEQKEAYSELGISQVFPIGREENGRRLFHAIMTLEQKDQAFEIVKEKDPKIISVTDKDGIAYGYKKVINKEAYSEGEEFYPATYKLVRDEELKEFECEDDTDYFKPYDAIDADGNKITVTPSGHCFGGWK